MYRAYPMRWYIAGVFVVFCVMQSAMWSFYSPISGSLMQLYGWSPYFIEWLGNTANIVFCVLVVPLGVWVDGRGMRVPMIVTIFALCINSGLRCLPRLSLGAEMFSTVSMVAMVFNGIAGTVETLSPPVLSALWFPANERTTATALMATANTLGTCVGFLTAFVVPAALPNDCSYLSLPANCSDPPPPPPDILAASNVQIDKAVTRVYFTYFAICAVAFLFVLFRFPDRPPIAPSASCAVARDVNLLDGLRALSRNVKFWLAVFCMSVPLGVYVILFFKLSQLFCVPACDALFAGTAHGSTCSTSTCSLSASHRATLHGWGSGRRWQAQPGVCCRGSSQTNFQRT